MDILDIGAAVSQSKGYTDQYLTTGSTPMGSWNASTNTPHITQGSGSIGQYYDVVEAGTWDGVDFLVGDRLLFAANSNKWERIPTGVEQDNIPVTIMYIDQTTVALPVQRSSGKPLVIGDNVKVKSTATLPFTIAGITFDSYSDEAVWNGTQWQEESYSVGKTNEVGVDNPTSESITGTAKYQSNINIENKLKFTNITSLINILDEEYKKAGFTFTATTDSSSGIDIITLNVKDKEDNVLLNVDLTGAMTPEELSAAIKDLPEELTNKTIDCGSFNPVP